MIYCLIIFNNVIQFINPLKHAKGYCVAPYPDGCVVLVQGGHQQISSLFCIYFMTANFDGNFNPGKEEECWGHL